METRATIKYLRVAPRKARLVAGLIRGLPVGEAEAELFLSPKRASGHIIKLLRSAIANAKEAKKRADLLYVKEIRVDGGPMLKRWMARARGTAGRIQKKTSHITIVLGELEHAPKQNFVIEKKQKNREDNEEERKKKSKRVEKEEVSRHSGIPQAAGEKKISRHSGIPQAAGEKKGSDKKGEKKTFFRRKSV